MKRIIYLLTIFVVSGCNHSDEIDIVMNRADSIMEACQNDAIMSLSMLDSLKYQLVGMSEAQRMRYHLLYSKAMNKGYVEYTSDSIMEKVVDYYSHHGSDYEKMTANYLLGCVYRDIGDAPSAMKYLNEATNYAQNEKASYRMLAHIHNQMAELLDKQVLVESELSELDIARQYAMLAGDTIEAITLLSLKAPAYELINQKDSAEMVIDSCISMFKEKGLPKFAAQISAYNLEYLIEKKDFVKARERIQAYETESGYFGDGNTKYDRNVFYYFKGLYYLGINQTDSAQMMFRKCLKYQDDPNIKVAAYHGLSLLYDKIGISDSTAKYALLAYTANDSAYQENVAEALIRQQKLYNYSKHQEDALKNAARSAKLWRWLLCLFAAFVIVILFYRIKRRIMQRKITTIRLRYETEKMLLQKEMERMNILLEKRQSLLEDKEELLKRKKEELNMEIEKYERSIAELQERVAGYERDINIKDIAVIEDDIQNAPIKDDFNYYLKNVMEHPSGKEWDKLTQFAKNNFPKLYVMLRNYNISQRELRICLLTRLMFKPKDIAVIVGCRFPEVSLTRSRLLKKIYGIEGKASDFDKRIMLIY